VHVVKSSDSVGFFAGLALATLRIGACARLGCERCVGSTRALHTGGDDVDVIPAIFRQAKARA